MSITTSPRPASAGAMPAAKPARAFLCDVPMQPFVEPPAPARNPGPTLGYHRADEDPRPVDDRCPALPPPIDARRRWMSA
jgi:hypothetical protein